jgi:hemolysin activation/secretion protein
MRQLHKIRCGVLSGVLLLALVSARAASATEEAMEADERVRQSDVQRREDLRRQEALSAPAVRTNAPVLVMRGPVDHETPCFMVAHIELVSEVSHHFQWLLADTEPYVQRCLGSKSLEALVLDLNDRLLQQGYVTSRVYAEPQDLKAGSLRLILSVGRIAAIDMTTAGNDRPGLAGIRAVLPISTGEALNIRDIDQAVETIQRLPGNKLDVLVEPGTLPATSHLKLNWQQAKPWHLMLAADNSSSRPMGRTRVSAQLRWDNLLGLADQVWVNLGSNAEHPEAAHRSVSGTLRYSVPFGYHRLGVMASRSQSGQRVAGTTANFLTHSHDREQQIEWQWVAYRDGLLKLTTEVAAGRRAGASYVEDVESITSRRYARFRHAGVTLDWRRDSTSFQASFKQLRVVRQVTEDEKIFRLFESAQGLSYQFEGQLAHAFNWLGQPWQYSMQWDVLSTRQAHVLGDVMSLGGRYSVRGFTGDAPVVAYDGAWVRQELQVASQPVAWCGSCTWSPYIGFDRGGVWGGSAQALTTRHVSGVVLGVRFFSPAFSADVALATPIRHPSEVPAPTIVPYVSLSWTL